MCVCQLSEVDFLDSVLTLDLGEEAAQILLQVSAVLGSQSGSLLWAESSLSAAVPGAPGPDTQHPPLAAPQAPSLPQPGVEAGRAGASQLNLQ